MLPTGGETLAQGTSFLDFFLAFMSHYKPFFVSGGMLVLVLAIDFIYRIISNQRPELWSTELVIFSLVHSLYQLMGTLVLKHSSLWGSYGKYILVAKTIVLLSTFAFTIWMYFSIQDKLKTKIYDALVRVCCNDVTKKKAEVCQILHIALDTVRPQLWQPREPSGHWFKVKYDRIVNRMISEKIRKREYILDLMEVLGIEGVHHSDLMLDSDDISSYRMRIAMVVMICIPLTIIPV